METSAAHLKETIKQILKDIRTKLLEEKFANEGQIEELVKKIQESNARDLVILKQQLGIVLTDMENMDTRAFKYTWKTRFLRAMMIGSSSKDRLDDDITEKKKVMGDLEDKLKDFEGDSERRSSMMNDWDELDKSFNLETEFERCLKLVGREKEKEEIIDQLMLLSSGEEVPVIIISGLKGIGKTKLAHHVCRDMGVKQQVGMAARVSGVDYNTFDADSIAKQAIRSVVAATIFAPHQHRRMTENNLNIIVILDDWRVEIEDKDMKALQDKLKEDWRVEIEGIDVKALQNELEGVGVEIEGIDGVALQKKLEEDNSSTVETELKEDVGVENEGIDVKALQKELEDVGVEIEGIDGVALQKELEEDNRSTVETELKEDVGVEIEGIDVKALQELEDVGVDIEGIDAVALQKELEEDNRSTVETELKEDVGVEIEGIDVKALQKELEDVGVEIEGIDAVALQKELEEDNSSTVETELKEDVGVEIEDKDVQPLQKKALDKLKEASPLVTAVMIITTSSCHVAMARNITASPVKSYALPELNEKEIVSILQLLVMDADDDWNLDPDYYWNVGKSRGVPGALLTPMLTLCDDDSQLTDSRLMEELTYSYYDEGLPHLCFAYCSLFPQDYLFDAERLIHLWMAEGFLKPSTSSSTSEPDEYLMAVEIGRKYLMDLVGRSIFQDVKEDELGQVRSFRMHPLMHDIARFVADRENITVDPKGYKVHQKVLRASFDLRLHFSHGIPSHPLFDKAKQLRSILFFATKTQSSLLNPHVVLENIFKSFIKSLVVLDLRGLKIKAVPNSIGELQCLEYLDLSQNDMEKLPSSITKLSKLQTLKLSRCYTLRELPKDFKKLKKLKHLDMEGCMGLTGMPPQMSDLRSSLQTLTAFVASKNENMGGLEELAELNQLRGYLEILYLDRVQPKPGGETNRKYLNEKRQLQRLKLKWDLGVEQTESHHMSVLDALEPHSDLGVLFLVGYQGETLSTWLTSIPFTGLVKLSLHNCSGCKYLSEHDQLPKLKILQLVRLDNLKYIVKTPNNDADFYKTLQELTIIDCPTLERWYEEWMEMETFFARISKLHVHNCPKLRRVPRLDMVLEGSTSTSFGKELVLEGSSLNLLLESVERSIPCENLHIQNCKDLKNLSNFFQHLGSLQRLTIENCAEIIKLDEGKSKLLEELEKKKFFAQSNLEDGKSNQYWEVLKSLRFLTLREMPNIRSLSFGDSIATLRELTLHSCHGLTSISDIGKLTSLRELSLHNCHGLTSISDSIGNVTSLRRLEISKCNKLKSLPKTMENLQSLKTLIILDCELLLPRCQRETGDDWPQILHIADIQVK